MIVLIKKGMALKAFLKYVQMGDMDNIKRQITKGLVKVLK